MKRNITKAFLIAALLLSLAICFTVDDTKTDHRPSRMKLHGRDDSKKTLVQHKTLSEILSFTAPNTNDGLNDKIRNRLTIEYSSCKEAWIDMFWWMALLYGDWYANHGGNSLIYFLYSWIWVKGPKWISLCFIWSIVKCHYCLSISQFK